MAWRVVKVEEQRKEFIRAWLEDKWSMAELCRRYEISTKNGYKWLNRYKKEGVDGLKDRSRAPHKQAVKTSDSIVREVLKIRFEYPTWGPKKVLAYLKKQAPSICWPSTTTIGNLFDKHGLTIERKLGRKVAKRTEPLSHCQFSNDVWCADFKGWFVTGDGNKYEPFTLTDASSRFLLRCVKLDRNDVEHVWAILDAAFREYGMPLFFRSDNGSPFATCGAGRLSRLSVNLIKAGITPEWIEPGKPQQNGRHERMHRTLKNEAATPPSATIEKQNMKLKEFVYYYNYIRPHEAIDQKTPGEVYTISSREWTGKLNSPEYSDEYLVRKVRPSGQISMRPYNIFIGMALEGEPIGLKPIENGAFEVYYGSFYLGEINQAKEFIYPRNSRKRNSFNSSSLTSEARGEVVVE